MNNNNENNKQNNYHKRKKHQSMKGLPPCIKVTAPVSHAEMSELNAWFSRNTTQTKAVRTTSGERRRWGIASLHVNERLTETHIGHGSRVPFRNVRIEGWIGVEHCTNKQKQVEQQVEGGGGEEFNKIKKHGVNNITTTINKTKQLPLKKRSITRWKTYCYS